LPQSFQNDAKYDADIQPEDSEKVVLSVWICFSFFRLSFLSFVSRYRAKNYVHVLQQFLASPLIWLKTLSNNPSVWSRCNNDTCVC
jgi:hypothetical protein